MRTASAARTQDYRLRDLPDWARLDPRRALKAATRSDRTAEDPRVGWVTRVVLHIGAPKTGTSFIQSVLSNNRPLLLSRGVLWPGQTWNEQVRAVEDLRDAAAGKRDQATRWDAIVEEVNAFDGSTAIISMEWLCLGDRAMAARAVNSFAGNDVRVVLAVRDLARVIPAQWQESTQNGFAWTYSDFLKGVTSRRQGREGPGGHFWHNQDWGRMASTWGSAVGGSRLWVVTVPPPGSPPHELWRRFCTAADMDPADYSLQGWPNESLGAASAELMRRLQAARREDGPSPRHRGRLKHRLAKQTLAHHRSSEPVLVLPDELQGWVVRRTRALVDDIQRQSPNLVGSYGDLTPAPAKPREGVVSDPGDLGDAALLDAAIFGLLGLTRPKDQR